MFEPVRGGTRGGQAEFKWSDVAQDKDRENYLGHSINAPAGRWQKNKDIHWYQRDASQDEEARLEEIRRVKEQEAEALSAVLGFGPSKPGGSSSGPASGANAVAVPSISTDDTLDPDAQMSRAIEKEEKKRRKAERKEEKRLRKEMKRAERHHRHRRDSRSPSPTHSNSRSLSPVGRRQHNYSERHNHKGYHGRSRSPPPRRERDRERHGREEIPREPFDNGYNSDQRERERERDRRRWDSNARRDRPGLGAHRARN